MREAWFALRDDRFYGSMGGMGGIYYSSLSRYARDRHIPISPFDQFVMAMDAEYVAVSNEKAKAEPETEDE